MTRPPLDRISALEQERDDWRATAETEANADAMSALSAAQERRHMAALGILHARIAKLEAALRQYAQMQLICRWPPSARGLSDIEVDCGLLARQALEEERSPVAELLATEGADPAAGGGLAE